ncbi:uncharacterized protein LOC144751956 [Lissotriton helveticus]
MDRPIKTGGGLAIVFRQEMEVVITETVCNPQMELLILTINPGSRETRKGALVYRPPGPPGNFSIHLVEALAPHLQVNSDFILVGDFNVHSEIDTCVESQTLLADLATLGFNQMNQGPTHIAGHTLDLVLYTSSVIKCLPPIQVDWTDHSIIEFHTRSNQRVNGIQRTMADVRRPWNKLTPKSFRGKYIEPNWVECGDNVTTALARFNEAVITTINHVVPSRTYKPRPAPKQEVWFTDDLRQLKLTARKLEKRWRVTRKIEDRDNYYISLKSYHKAIRSARKHHIAAQLSAAGKNAKVLYQILQTFIKPIACETEGIESQELCDNISQFFVRKIEGIYTKILTSKTIPNNTGTVDSLVHPHLSTTDNKANRLIEFPPISLKEITILITHIKSGCPSDIIPAWVMSLLSDELGVGIQQVVNLSLSTGEVPLDWKHALVRPLRKNNSIPWTDLTNLRPISLLPFLGKLTEKFVNQHLSKYIESTGGLDPSQSGFRQRHSTKTALLSVADDLHILQDKGYSVILSDQLHVDDKGVKMAANGHTLLLALLLSQIGLILANTDECSENEFADEYGQCVLCKECGPGQELSKECGYGEGGDAKCVACSSRRYKKDWGHHRCISCLSCILINRSQRSNCTAQADAICGECLPGFYSKTRIGGVKEQECIPCTSLTSPAETQCNRKAGPMKLESSTPPPRDMTTLLVGASSAFAMTALALVILSAIYCRRFLKKQCMRAILSSSKLTEASVTIAGCSSQPSSQCSKQQLHNPCALGGNTLSSNQQTQGPVEELHCALDSHTSSLQPHSQPCPLQPGPEHPLPFHPSTGPQFTRRVSETQPLIRHSGSSDCSAGCSSCEMRSNPVVAPESFGHPPMSATVSCASEQCQHRWAHAPVECTELDLHRFSMEQECLGTMDSIGPIHRGTPETTESSTGPPDQPQETSSMGFQHFNIENGMNEFQSLVIRISNATQGLRLGKLPQAVVLLLSLRLDPHLPGVKNYMDVGAELGVAGDLMSQMSGYGHLHAYLSSSSLCTLPGLMQALHRLQRFDALSVLCEHFAPNQDQEDPSVQPH